MSVDRSVAPEVRGFEDFVLRKPEIINFLDHSTLLHLHDSKVHAAKCEFVFKAGKIYDHHPADSLLTSKLLPFNRLSSGQKIQEFVDSFGGYLDISSNDDYCTVTLYCLSKYLEKLLAPILEMLQVSNFKINDFETIQRIAEEQLAINLTKGKFIANQKFKKQLFADSPYARPVLPPDIAKSSLKALQTFHDLSFDSPILISVSGNYEPSSIQKLLEAFGSSSKPQPSQSHPFSEIDLKPTISEQASIRIGSRLSFEDVNSLNSNIYNMLLGGYFGSRLMSTLREKHGLTYGISSSLNQNESYGYWVIQSEVKRENTNQAVDLVLEEIKGLAELSVTNDELNNCKNQLIGDLVSSTSNVFLLAHVHKQLVLNKQSHSQFDNYVSKLDVVDIKNIQGLANQFLQLELVTIS